MPPPSIHPHTPPSSPAFPKQRHGSLLLHKMKEEVEMWVTKCLDVPLCRSRITLSPGRLLLTCLQEFFSFFPWSVWRNETGKYIRSFSLNLDFSRKCFSVMYKTYAFAIMSDGNKKFVTELRLV